MIRLLVKPAILVVPLAVAAAAACSSEPAETFGSGGTGNGAGTSSTAGTASPTAGTQSSGGGNAAGGNSSGAGTSNAGTANTAGTASGGTASGGSGGTNSAGGSAGSNSGGSGGSAGGSGDCETVECVAGMKNQNMDAFSSSFFMFGCYSKAQQDCITNPPGTQCNADGSKPFEQQGFVVKQTFKVGGTPGKKYALTIKVNGIAEAKYYEKGTRAAGETDPANPNVDTGVDTFYTGGNPIDFENYNVYKITPLDAQGKEVNHYYLNSFPKTNTPYEAHQTFPIGFTHDIEVVGGGTIELLQADRNCHAIDNCGSGYKTTSCANSDGRKIPNEPDLMLPTSWNGQQLSQINLYGGNAQPYHSQVIHITVTQVKPM
ncbi:MAG TPA: hypothetical protein VHB79_30870 [Polyangiaceae bacterium]|nr:hypothetical protein [Polyangiaceae bacterium]